MAIKSFKCAENECLFRRLRVKRFVSIEAVARRKLEQLEWTEMLDVLAEADYASFLRKAASTVDCRE